jgi:hypothetical protein
VIYPPTYLNMCWDLCQPLGSACELCDIVNFCNPALLFLNSWSLLRLLFSESNSGCAIRSQSLGWAALFKDSCYTCQLQTVIYFTWAYVTPMHDAGIWWPCNSCDGGLCYRQVSPFWGIAFLRRFCQICLFPAMCRGQTIWLSLRWISQQ